MKIFRLIEFSTEKRGLPSVALTLERLSSPPPHCPLPTHEGSSQDISDLVALDRSHPTPAGRARIKILCHVGRASRCLLLDPNCGGRRPRHVCGHLTCFASLRSDGLRQLSPVSRRAPAARRSAGASPRIVAGSADSRPTSTNSIGMMSSYDVWALR